MKRLRLFGFAVPMAALVAVLVAVFAGGAAGGAGNHLIRWDLIQLAGGPAPATITLSPGGKDSALANDGSKITLSGSGTFRSNPGNPQSVSGGGSWWTFSPTGSQTGTGTYEVTGFVSFADAPGGLPFPPFQDNIVGDNSAALAGLAVLTIAYSDGSEGVLTVSCDLPTTPASFPLFEGITASKGPIGYWNRLAPTGGPTFGPNENRTAFRVLH